MKKFLLLVLFASLIETKGQISFLQNSFTVPIVPRGLTLADFTNDGKLDVVTAGYNVATLLTGNGLGGLTVPVDSFYTISEFVTHGDINNDGKMDLIVPRPMFSSVVVMFGDGTGNFPTRDSATVASTPIAAVCADFNGDGFPDLASCNYLASGTISVVLGNGTGNFSLKTDYPVGNSPKLIKSGDFNGDGFVDLVAINEVSNNISVLYGTGTGSFGATTNYPLADYPNSLCCADFNGDGLEDIAVSLPNINTVKVFLSSGLSFGLPTSYNLSSSPSSITSADFNSDGFQDLTVASNSTIFVFIANGSGGFNASLNTIFSFGASTLLSGDFNGDGTPDLGLSSGGDYTVKVFICTDKAIGGFIYKDNNSDCLKNTGDSLIPAVPLKIYDNIGTLLGTTYSQSNGKYFFAVPTGTYTVVVDTTGLPTNSLCPYPGIDSAVVLSGLDTNINFSLACKPGFDIGIKSVVALGLVFPGQLHTLNFVIGDMSQYFNLNCVTGISGQVQITVAGQVAYMGPASGSFTPTITGNTYTYNIPDFGTVNNSNDFNLNFLTDTTAQAGAVICVTITVTPTSGDLIAINNFYQYCYNVRNSHDPNLKEVYPVDVAPGYTDWFTYTVHFQNSGNAPAINIKVTDMLDSNLDVSTFEFLASSHYSTVSLNGNYLTVKFPNIFLPDSLSNPLGSMGYFQYRVKPKATWPLNDPIENTAYIYFDYNPPVITNTSVNSIITGIKTFEAKTLKFHPNPTSSRLFIDQINEGNYKIINQLGQVCTEGKLKKEIIVSDLIPGIYFLIITDKSGYPYIAKFVKE